MEIDRVGSITQAAQNLYMAQPNLSKAMKELEREIGFPIFKRSATGVKATEKGSEFLYYAKRIVEQLGAIDRMKQNGDNHKLCYKISIPRGSYITEGFTSFVSELSFQKGTEITLNETNTMETISNVSDGGYNVGIIRYQVSDEEYFLNALKNHRLNYETIWEFAYVVVMSKMHPLAEKKDICADDLKEYTKIAHGDIEIPHERAIARSRNSGGDKVIYVYERGSQFDLLTNVPTTYMWVSVIPQGILDKNQLVQRKCKAENNLYKDVLIFRKDYQLNEYDRLFQKKIYESKVDVSLTAIS